MNMHAAFPYRLQWTSEQIADAVPLRLFELAEAVFIDFDPRAGNDMRASRPRTWRGAYRTPTALPALVRVRH